MQSLFDQSLPHYLQSIHAKMKEEVDELPLQDLVSGRTDANAAAIADSHRLRLAEIDADAVGYEDPPCDDHVDVGQVPTRIVIPFRGDPVSFSFMGDTSPHPLDFNWLRIASKPPRIIFFVDVDIDQPGQIREEVSRAVRAMQHRLDAIRADVDRLNNSLLSRARELIELRRQRALNHASLVARLRESGLKVYGQPADGQADVKLMRSRSQAAPELCEV
jgi:hypothetical protein